MTYWLHSSAIAVPSKNYDLETMLLRNILKTTWRVSLCKAVWVWFVYFLVWHDDVIKWKPVNSPHKGQWRGALMFSMICALNKRLSKQSWSWWFETPSHSLWRQCNATIIQWWTFNLKKSQFRTVQIKLTRLPIYIVFSINNPLGLGVYSYGSN